MVSIWLDQPIVEFATHVLGKRQRKAWNGGRSTPRNCRHKERYRLQIRLKKLRYATEFFEAGLSEKAHQAVAHGS